MVCVLLNVGHKNPTSYPATWLAACRSHALLPHEYVARTYGVHLVLEIQEILGY